MGIRNLVQPKSGRPTIHSPTYEEIDPVGRSLLTLSDCTHSLTDDLVQRATLYVASNSLTDGCVVGGVGLGWMGRVQWCDEMRRDAMG